LEIEEAMMKVYQEQRDQLGRLGSQDETAVRTLVRTQIQYAYEASPFFVGHVRNRQRVLAFLHALAKQLPPESAAFPKRIEQTTAKLPECSDSDYGEVPRKLRTKRRRRFDLNTL
jgi:glutamine synthetase adenylyltransferase